MFNSLVSRLVLLVSGAIFLVVIATSAVYQREYGALLSERIIEAIQQDMSTGSRRFEQEAQKLRGALLFLLMSPSVKAITEAELGDDVAHVDHLPELFETYLEANPSVMQVQYIPVNDAGREALFVSRVDGQIRVGASSQYSPFEHRDYLQFVEGLQPLHITSSQVRLLRDRYGNVAPSGASFMLFASPIVLPSGEPVGVIAAHINVGSVFQQKKSSIDFLESYLPGSENFIVNAKGEYILHPDSERAMQYEFGKRSNIVDDWPEVEEFIDDDDDRSAFLYSNSGDHIILVERFNAGTVEDPNCFFLVLVAPLESVFSDLYQLQIYILLFTLTLVFFVVLISGTYIRRKLRPLQRLSRTMRSFNPGQPFEPIDDVQSNDEISAVTHSFNLMAEQLRELFLQERTIREGLNQFAIVSSMNVDGTIVEVNEKFTQFFGYARSEVVGQHSSRYRSGLHSDDFYKNLWEAVLAGNIWREDMSYRAKDSSIVWMETALVPLIDRSGGVGYILNIQFDITDRRRLLNEVQKQRNKAEHASRVKSNFLASMSHELRTPLNSIIGFSQRLKRKLKSELKPRDMDAVETIERNGQHLLQVINEILDVAKVESGKMTVMASEFDLSMLLKEARLTMTTQVKQRKLAFAEHLPEGEVPVFLDRKKTLQILLNLLSNAVKYTEEGQVSISLVEDGDKVVIAVSDTGIGIRQEDLPKLFNRFTRLESSLNNVVEGTGLGLVLIEEFALMQGGEVQVVSEYGVGSTFSVILPKRYGHKNY